MQPDSLQSLSDDLKSNRVFQAIRQMAASDLKSLMKFMQSPYFNQSKTLTRLCQAFVDLVLKGKDGFIKEKVWAKVYTGKAYNDVSFRKACSDLLELVEQYMSTEVYLADQARLQIDKIDYLSRHKVTSLYRNAINDNLNLLNSKQYWTQKDYYNAYLFERKYHQLMNFDVKMNQKINIEKISENLDVFFLIDKLKIISNSLTQKIISAVDYDLNDVPAILKLCEKYELENYPELAIYYYSYHTLTDGDNLEHYYKLKNVLENNAGFIPQVEGIEIFDTALNYCIGRVNKGDKQFLQEYFDIFEKAINKGVFIVNGELAAWRFNNIVVTGLRLGKMDWAQDFVEENKKLLPNDTRNNMVNFNMARISSYKKDFENVLKLVRDIEYDDIIINLISKTMIVFAYYELDEYDALDSFIETYRTFINRQKDIRINLKQGYLNLLGFVRRLTRIKTGDKVAIQKLRDEIMAIKSSTVNHEWLLEKLEELS